MACFSVLQSTWAMWGSMQGSSMSSSKAGHGSGNSQCRVCHKAKCSVGGSVGQVPLKPHHDMPYPDTGPTLRMLQQLLSRCPNRTHGKSFKLSSTFVCSNQQVFPFKINFRFTTQDALRRLRTASAWHIFDTVWTLTGKSEKKSKNVCLRRDANSWV